MADGIWDIVVMLETGKRKIIQVPSRAKMDDLFKQVANLISNASKNLGDSDPTQDLDPSKLVIIFAGVTIPYGSGKTVSDWNIIDGSLIIPAFLVLGGVWPMEALKTKKYNLQPLPGYITVTSSEDDIDMITLDNNPSESRAKMPCGHVIGPASMTSLCHSILSQGMFQFNCPQCSQEWPYFLVRHVACLTGDEMRTFEQRVSNTSVAKNSQFKACPRCNSLCYKGNVSTNRVSCIICIRKGRSSKNFCWICLNDWKNDFGSKCGNSNCDGLDKTIAELAKCPLKKIRELEFPSMRGCPKCGSVIVHKDGCKHMTCRCKHSFCFACLKPLSPSGKWECTAYGTECGVSPRQTTLPRC